MAVRLGEAFVTIGTRDDALKKGLVTARRDVTSAVSSISSSAVSVMTGVIGAGIAQAVGSGIVSTIKAGFKAVDDYRIATIGIASNLTDMAAKSNRSLESIYGQNLKYAQETYSKIEVEAAKHFASGKEMILGWQMLSQKGVMITSDKDIENLGIIVDKIKLATAGQNSEIQISQELRSVLDGQARATSQIAMQLKDRLGPEWEKIIEKAKANGTILDLLASQYKGLGAASQDIEKTISSQLSTTSTLVTKIGRTGLQGAYEDVSEVIQDINRYLTVHYDNLSKGIQNVWTDVKGVLTDPALTRFFTDLLSTGASDARSLGESLWDAGKAVKSIISSFNELPDSVRGAAGTGIIGAMFFGVKGGAALAMFAIINDGLATANAHIGSIVTSYKSLLEVQQNLVDVATGKRDAMTGRRILPPGAIQKPMPTPWQTDDKGRTIIDINTNGAFPVPIAKQGGEATKKTGAGPLSLSDIDQSIERIQDRAAQMNREFADLGYELAEATHRNNNRLLEAELMDIERWSVDTNAKVWKEIEQAQRAYDELVQKMGGKRGATAEARAAMDQAKAGLDRTWWLGLASMDTAGNLRQEKIDAARKASALEIAESTARLRDDVAKLTGDYKVQADASVKLLEAEKARALASAQTAEQQELIRQKFDEQIRLANLQGNGSYFDGFKEAMNQYNRTSGSAYAMGKQFFDVAQEGFRGIGTSIRDAIQGTKSLGDAFSDLISRMANRVGDLLMDQAFNAIFGALLGGGSASGGASWLSGLFGGGSDLSSSPISTESLLGGWNPGFASGGISTGPTRGYMARLHGTEAVVPLSGGRSIPVSLRGQSSGPNIVIEQHGTDVIVDRITPDEIRIIARQVVSEDAPRVVAGDIGNPNGRVSKAITNHTSASRKRV